MNSSSKIDIGKMIKDSLIEMEEMENLKPEDLDITKEEAKELLQELAELKEFALKTREMVCRGDED